MDNGQLCPRCGTRRLQDGRFCATCGLDLQVPTAPSSPPIPPDLVPAISPDVPPSRAASAEPGSQADTDPMPPIVPHETVGSVPFVGPGASRRRLAVLATFLAVLVALLTWTTYSTNRDLAITKDNLSTANTSLASTASDLLAETAAEKASAAKVNDLTSQVTQMQSALSRQTDCSGQLGSELDELNRIESLAQANFNMAATGSVWAVADVARNAATAAVVSDYYNAYTAAFNSDYSTANSWIQEGNAQIGIAVAKLKVMSSQIDKIDAQTKAIEAALAALTTRVTTTKASCSGTGTT